MDAVEGHFSRPKKMVVPSSKKRSLCRQFRNISPSRQHDLSCRGLCELVQAKAGIQWLADQQERERPIAISYLQIPHFPPSFAQCLQYLQFLQA